MAMKIYRVVRQHYGDRQYLAGDSREMEEQDAKPLLGRVLSEDWEDDLDEKSEDEPDNKMEGEPENKAEVGRRKKKRR